MQEVLAIVGVGGMGLACARRMGFGRALLLADIDAPRLQAAAEALRRDGFGVTTRELDIADRKQVDALANDAVGLGTLRTLVHTAGYSPHLADGPRIYEVNFRGAVNVLDAFEPLCAPGTVAVLIASMAGYAAPVPRDIEQKLATGSIAEGLEAVRAFPAWEHASTAYLLTKRGVQLRVEAGARAWGARGGRIVSISPGIIATPMGRHEMTHLPFMADLVEQSPVARIGAAEDIASAAEWLASPAASFITGVDLLVDGGATAVQRWQGFTIPVAGQPKQR